MHQVFLFQQYAGVLCVLKQLGSLCWCKIFYTFHWEVASDSVSVQIEHLCFFVVFGFGFHLLVSDFLHDLLNVVEDSQ